MINLRRWQHEAISAALKKFEQPFSHFLCLATPGAGKTVMASTLAKMLIKKDKVDLVLCFSPSTVVANDFKVELETITKKRFCGGLGATGSSLTYQSMRYLDTTFWSLLDTSRVFVIFDEIHHCAGDDLNNANAWGEQILSNIQGRAHYTIALTGTPWRSDAIPIVLANYLNEDYKLQIDYRYDLTQAVKDGVCRAPYMTLVDNEHISVTGKNDENSYTSITNFVYQSKLSYFELISHDAVIRQILKCGILQLNKERRTYIDAGGLIVAASITHAKHIQQLLNNLGEQSDLVTYQEDEPGRLIQNFKNGGQKWIISIGMISEGTNIPRLRVCCYLSLVTTELYFRQVMGRVLRAQYSNVETGYLIMPAHPRLLEYSNRVAEEVPHYAVIKSSRNSKDNGIDETIQNDNNALILRNVEQEIPPETPITHYIDVSPPTGHLTSWYDSSIDSFGRFRQKVFML